MSINSLEILKFFPEPIFKYKLENFKDLNKELSKYIYSLKKKIKKVLKNLIKVDGTLKILK